MAKFRPGLRQIVRIFLTRGIAALLLLQTLALAFAEARPMPLAPGLDAASRLCAPISDGGHDGLPTAPSRADRPGHCLCCPLSYDPSDAVLATLLTATLLLLAPPHGAENRRAFVTDAWPLAGATGVRPFSRAPPAA
ncbi:hypothetical protein [Methylosinus sp. PW1]|uniref:hypothetical protein n=1 Tax=Methylosinus sp. PW1 TaxID=107636 RepID=UPI00055EE451|nr:hypothetical protein [Methylosinus sp. PW1]